MDDTIAPAVPIRPAAKDDLPAIGGHGALLVRMHHDADRQRFIAATCPERVRVVTNPHLARRLRPGKFRR